MKKKQILLPLLSAMLFGCSGHSGSTGNSPSSLSELQAKFKGVAGAGGKVEEIDPYDQALYNPPENGAMVPKTTCSSDNGVCAVQSDSRLSSSFTIGASGKSAWVVRDVLGYFVLKFNKDISKTYRVSDIYNDLGAWTTTAGYITEIDTSDCDSLIASGRTKGQECKIKFAYSGETVNNTSQEIHFELSDGSKQTTDNLDVVYTAKNVSTTLKNVPVLNMATANSSSKDDGSSDIITINYPFEASQNGFMFPSDKVDAFYLSNVGTGALNKRDDNLFNMRVLDSTASSAGVYYAQQTSCQQYETLKSGNTCTMPLSFMTDQISEELVQGGPNRLVLNYNQSDSAKPITYAKRVIFSPGLFQPYSASLTGSVDQRTSSWFANLSIGVSNLGSNALSYAVAVNNAKFSLEYDPKFYLTHKVINVSSDRYRLVYSYGTTGSFSSQEKLLSSLQITPDSACFESHEVDDITGDLNNDNSLLSHHCNVKVAYDNANSFTNLKKPIAAMLVVTYKNDLYQTPIKQVLGTVSFDPSAAIPKPEPVSGKRIYYRITKSLSGIRGLEEDKINFFPVQKKSLMRPFILSEADSISNNTMVQHDITDQVFAWVNNNRETVCTMNYPVTLNCTFSLGDDEFNELARPLPFTVVFTIPYGQNWVTYPLNGNSVSRIEDASTDGRYWAKYGQSLIDNKTSYILNQNYVYDPDDARRVSK